MGLLRKKSFKNLIKIFENHHINPILSLIFDGFFYKIFLRFLTFRSSKLRGRQHGRQPLPQDLEENRSFAHTTRGCNRSDESCESGY